MKSVAQLEAEHQAWADSQQTVSRCLADGCDWTFEGTAAAGRQAHAEHRVARHPELARKPRRRRHRTFLEQALEARERRLGKRQEAA